MLKNIALDIRIGCRMFFEPLIFFIKSIKEFWIATWLQSKILFLAEMIGTLCGMAAATIMGFQAPDPNLLAVFLLYNVSAILFIYTNYVRQSAWLMILMTFYLITTTIGLVQVL